MAASNRLAFHKSITSPASEHRHCADSMRSPSCGNGRAGMKVTIAFVIVGLPNRHGPGIGIGIGIGVEIGTEIDSDSDPDG